MDSRAIPLRAQDKPGVRLNGDRLRVLAKEGAGVQAVLCDARR